MTEEGLADLLFEYSTRLRRMVAEAEADIKAGRLVTWENFLRHESRQPAT